jgi:hypothetical protein
MMKEAASEDCFHGKAHFPFIITLRSHLTEFRSFEKNDCIVGYIVVQKKESLHASW